MTAVRALIDDGRVRGHRREVSADQNVIEALLVSWALLHEKYTHAPFLLGAAVMALVGWWLLGVARRVWLNAELG